MSNMDYNELFRAIGKDAFADMIKANIHSNVPEPYASMYVRQFEDFKCLADYLEYMAKQMRR